MPRKKPLKKKITRKKKVHKLDTIKRYLFGLFFILFGLLYIYTYPLIFQEKHEVASSKEPIVAGQEFKKEKEESEVKRIIIPDLSIDLEVTPSKLINGYWETSETTASHGLGSKNPGESGNIVIFAHAREGLFLDIRGIEKDSVVYVLTKDKWHRYKVTETSEVLPTETRVVAPTESEELTLFTCSGFFDEKRLIVKALPH